jgi:gamma-glutamyltranspeptidase/glutathione hydrolase
MIEARKSEFDRFDYASADATHYLTEALAHAFADRSRHLADPAFVPVPVLTLTSAANIRDLATRIDMTRTQPAESYGSRLPSAGSQELRDAGTSHLSAVDSFGNAVACTETINLEFGSMLVVKGFGFVLNNQMDDFTTRPGQANAFGLRQDERNLPAPGKQPLSSMSPTIVLLEDGGNAEVELVVGASGGPRIITGTLQVMLDSIIHDIPASRAVAQPRIHHQWMPRTLTIEPDLAAAPDVGGNVASILTKRGHEVKIGSSECAVQAVRRSPRERNRFEAGSDPRKGGKPAGR